MKQRCDELLEHQATDLLDDLKTYGFSKMLGEIHGVRIRAETISMLNNGRKGFKNELQERVIFDAIMEIHRCIDNVETIAEALVSIYAPKSKIPRTRDRRYFAEPDCGHCLEHDEI